MDRNPRDILREYREANNFTLRQMADYCGIGETLYSIIEHGGNTHPNIANKIGRLFDLTELQTEELMPENRRPHSPKYDPEKYVEHISLHPDLKKAPVTWIQKEE